MIITAVVFCFIAVVGVALSFEHLALVVVVCGRYSAQVTDGFEWELPL